MLLAAILLALHSFGEAFHFRAHLPQSQMQTRRSSVYSASTIVRSVASIAVADDDCAFCALTATIARQSAPPPPAVTAPLTLAFTRSFAPALASLAPCCRPRAPGPPRAPPVFFL